MKSNVLTAFNSNIEKVVYDPTNKFHNKVAHDLVVNLKQHPTIRFILEEEFSTVPLMIMYKSAEYFLENNHV